MSKIKLALEVAEDLRKLAESIETLANSKLWSFRLRNNLWGDEHIVKEVSNLFATKSIDSITKRREVRAVKSDNEWLIDSAISLG